MRCILSAALFPLTLLQWSAAPGVAERGRLNFTCAQNCKRNDSSILISHSFTCQFSVKQSVIVNTSYSARVFVVFTSLHCTLVSVTTTPARLCPAVNALFLKLIMPPC